MTKFLIHHADINGDDGGFYGHMPFATQAEAVQAAKKMIADDPQGHADITLSVWEVTDEGDETCVVEAVTTARMLTLFFGTPEVDPYHADTNGLTRTTIHLDPKDGEVHVFQLQDYGGTRADVAYGQTMRHVFDEERGSQSAAVFPDPEALRSYLSGDEARALVDRIMDGYSVQYNGQNMVGVLNNDATAAWEAFVGELDGLPDATWTAWTVDEWLSESGGGVKADMSDDDLEALAETIRTQAKDEDVVLADEGELLAWLKGKRAELVAEAE